MKLNVFRDLVQAATIDDFRFEADVIEDRGWVYINAEKLDSGTATILRAFEMVIDDAFIEGGGGQCWATREFRQLAMVEQLIDRVELVHTWETVRENSRFVHRLGLRYVEGEIPVVAPVRKIFTKFLEYQK